MAGEAGTLEFLAQQVGLALQPLEAQLTPANIIPFLSELGLQFPPQLTSQAAFMNAVNAGSTAVGALPGLLNQLATDISNDNDNDAGIVQDGIQLIQTIGTIVSALQTIGTQLGSIAGSLPGLNAAEVTTFSGDLASNLLSYLLISYVEDTQPGVIGIANLLGIVSYVHHAGVAGDPTHPPYVSRQLQLSNLGQLMTGPSELLKTLFGWGSSTFNGSDLLPVLNESLNLLGLNSQLNSTGPPSQLFASLLTMKVNPATNPPGLLATLSLPIPAPFSLTLPLSSNWSVNIQTSGTFSPGLSATITPPTSVSLKLLSGTLTGQLQTNLLDTAPDANDPLIIFGETGGSVLQANSFSFGAGVNVTWDTSAAAATADPSVQFAVTGGKLIIDMSDADGFLADVTSGAPIQATFDLAATWAPDTGLHITGGGQLQLTVPLNLDLGPVTLPTLYIDVGVGSSGITPKLLVDLGITLGPIQASVDHVGMKALLSFPGQGGNLGPADLSIGFSPPNGLGLAVDMGPVTGGGYIAYDDSKKQYSGLFALAILDTVTVTVVGVIDTELPDGSLGYSFVLIITLGLPPIQLGFGFTLNGVGGLGGINRTMVIDALRAGLRAHTLDAILFPPDPIGDAPQIISDIESFFPPQQGRYLFGPMVSIGWGTPQLLDFEVAVMLEVPDPVRLAIIGTVNATIPDPDFALMSLKVDVLGTVDFGLEKLSIDGTMYDSYLLEFQLAGDMALRFNWGGNADFLFSLGGFNPKFQPPPDMPTLQRLSVSLGAGSNPQLSSNSYFAVTSNSLQFGANVHAYASAGGFTVQGQIGYDTLFILSPFSFDIDFSAGFDIAYKGHSLAGIQLDGDLSGPRPFHLHGDASFHILFFHVSASIDLTWGDSTTVTLPSVPVLPQLTTALGNPGNWTATLPPNSLQAVVLRQFTPAPNTIVVHPMGTLSVRETVVPLDTPITLFNGAPPADGNTFSITAVTLNATPANYQPQTEEFALGQFTTMSNADKLSAPSFEPRDAGIAFGALPIANGDDQARTINYEERYIDDYGLASRFGSVYSLPANIHAVLVNSGAGSASPVKHTGLRTFKTPGTASPISIDTVRYCVTSTTDLSLRTDILAGSATRYTAVTALQSHLAQNPQDRGTVQVIPVYEAAA